jgi:hypothetical protein
VGSLGLSVVIVVAFAGAARAQSADESFYAAFKTFCADTGAKSDLVKGVVEAAPFTVPHNPSGTATTVPYPMTTASWDINWNGHKYIVSIDTSRAPYGPGRKLEAASCSVLSFADEEASLAAIRKWVGIQPDPNSSSGITFYSYREDGSARVAIIGDDAVKSAIAEGSTWLLTVRQQPNIASVQLMRFQTPPPRNSN